MKMKLFAILPLILAAMLLTLPGFVAAREVDRDAWRQAETRLKLAHGMTRSQVENVLGRPSRERVTRSAVAVTLDLEYRSIDDRDWMVLNFMDGRHLSGYSVARLGVPQEGTASEEPWRVRSTWQKVSPGMTEDEVQAILGKPTAKAYASGLHGAEVLGALLYDIGPETDNATGIVMLADGRVVSVMTPLFPTQ